MLEGQFFPTPPEVARKMVEPLVHTLRDGRNFLSAKRVLEPSAGAGAILDLCCKEYDLDEKRGYSRHSRKNHLFCCEIDPELRAILAEKGYQILETDFLEYREPVTFDLILMNPPFDAGAKHVLHAWNFLDGELVALVNAATIRNPHTKERQLLKHLIEAHGTVEYWGQCFKDAERRTDVEVACVRLTRKRSEDFDFEQGKWGFSSGIRDEEFNPDTLSRPNAVRDLVARYQAAERVIVERRRLQRQLDFLLDGVSSPVMDSVGRKSSEALANEVSLEDQIAALKSRFWQTLFNKTGLEAKITQKFQEKFVEFSQQKAGLAFSEQNIKEIIDLFMLNHEQLMNDCLLDLFDQCTRFHEKNKIHVEGWKTNQGHKINHKIIMPYGLNNEYGWSINFSNAGFFTDLDKVLCWIWGVKLDQIRGTRRSIENFCNEIRRGRDFTEKFDSTFFEIRVYKKGTVHLTFKDKALLDEFNIRAAQGKGWLPGEGF